MKPLLLPNLLTPSEVAEVNRLMDDADYEDGRATAGGSAQEVKANRQVSRRSPAAAALDAIIDAGLRRCRPFREVLSPSAVSPVLYSRYTVGDGYGAHVDSVMGGMRPMRHDLSMTIFLSAQERYEGGALRLHEADPADDCRLEAGSAIAYSTTCLHEVTPVTAGERRVAVLWVQSFYRDPEIRQIVADLRRCVAHAKTIADGRPLAIAQALANLERKFIGS